MCGAMFIVGIISAIFAAFQYKALVARSRLEPQQEERIHRYGDDRDAGYLGLSEFGIPITGLVMLVTYAVTTYKKIEKDTFASMKEFI